MPPTNSRIADAVREEIPALARTWRTERYVRLAAILAFSVALVFTMWALYAGAWPVLIGFYATLLIALGIAFWMLRRTSRR